MSEEKKTVEGNDNSLKGKSGNVSLRDKLNLKSKATIMINGHEVIIGDYMLNPTYYNNLPMKEEFKKEIKDQHEEAVETKKKLQQSSIYDTF